ncbi:MAG TPA: hypothetical protein VFM00_00810 [Candidatus Eisenbacteria bacterium]|nr:hypothetical protein [Candidatus Eisenbacteria bacterium]
MSQRKLIVSLTIAVLLAISAGVSQASLSRMEGMGLDVPLLSQFTDDYANIYTYPTSVVRQNNLVLAELGQNPNDGEANPVDVTDQTYTVIRNFPRIGAIAFQMAQSQTDVLTGSGNLNNEQLDMIWGRAFSNFDFAVRLDITNSKFEESTNAPASIELHGNSPFDPGFGVIPFFVDVAPDAILGNGIELNTYGITPSFALHFGEDDRFEAAATYRRYTLDRTQTPAGGESWQDQGNASYGAFARLIMHRGGTHTWYPAAWYVNDDLSWEMTGLGARPTVSADETYKNYGLGISDNMRVNDNNLLLWGVSVGQFKHEYERTDQNTGGALAELHTFEDKSTMLPLVFAAIETEATSWLKIRIGASRGHLVERTESADFNTPSNTDLTKESLADFNLGLGAGIRWNNLDIDMAINNQFPLSGGWILSGNEATPFNRVSATYHF